MAFLDFVLAESASESWPALALETLQRVAAGAAVLVLLTPADVVLELFAPEAQGVQAAEVSLHVLALAAIEARIARAFVHLDGTVGLVQPALQRNKVLKKMCDAGSVLPARRRRPMANVHFGLVPLAGRGRSSWLH